MKLLRRRGQSIGEYAILLGIVLGAIFAVQHYIRNRIMGTIQAKADLFAGTSTAGAKGTGVSTVSESVSDSTLDYETLLKGKVQSGSQAKSTVTVTP